MTNQQNDGDGDGNDGDGDGNILHTKSEEAHKTD